MDFKLAFLFLVFVVHYTSGTFYHLQEQYPASRYHVGYYHGRQIIWCKYPNGRTRILRQRPIYTPKIRAVPLNTVNLRNLQNNWRMRNPFRSNTVLPRSNNVLLRRQTLLPRLRLNSLLPRQQTVLSTLPTRSETIDPAPSLSNSLSLDKSNGGMWDILGIDKTKALSESNVDNLYRPPLTIRPTDPIFILFPRINFDKTVQSESKSLPTGDSTPVLPVVKETVDNPSNITSVPVEIVPIQIGDPPVETVNTVDPAKDVIVPRDAVIVDQITGNDGNTDAALPPVDVANVDQNMIVPRNDININNKDVNQDLSKIDPLLATGVELPPIDVPVLPVDNNMATKDQSVDGQDPLLPPVDVAILGNTQTSVINPVTPDLITRNDTKKISCQKTGCDQGSVCILPADGTICLSTMSEMACECRLGCQLGFNFIPLEHSITVDECGNICSCNNMFGQTECTQYMCNPDVIRASNKDAGASIDPLIQNNLVFPTANVPTVNGGKMNNADPLSTNNLIFPDNTPVDLSSATRDLPGLTFPQGQLTPALTETKEFPNINQLNEQNMQKTVNQENVKQIGGIVENVKVFAENKVNFPSASKQAFRIITDSTSDIAAPRSLERGLVMKTNSVPAYPPNDLVIGSSTITLPASTRMDSTSKTPITVTETSMNSKIKSLSTQASILKTDPITHKESTTQSSASKVNTDIITNAAKALTQSSTVKADSLQTIQNVLTDVSTSKAKTISNVPKVSIQESSTKMYTVSNTQSVVAQTSTSTLTADSTSNNPETATQSSSVNNVSNTLNPSPETSASYLRTNTISTINSITETQNATAGNSDTTMKTQTSFNRIQTSSISQTNGITSTEVPTKPIVL